MASQEAVAVAAPICLEDVAASLNLYLPVAEDQETFVVGVGAINSIGVDKDVFGEVANE